MLPVPFIDSMPKEITTEGGDDLLAFCGAIDDVIDDSIVEVEGLGGVRDVASASVSMLGPLGDMYYARIKNLDSESVKRGKIAMAIEEHKDNALWATVKVIIDLVTGSNAVLYSSLIETWPVRIQNAVDFADGREWSLRGDIIRTGSGVEIIIPGNVYIDVGTSALTPAQIVQLVEELTDDRVPAYYRVVLGYTTAGVFTAYAGGVIG